MQWGDMLAPQLLYPVNLGATPGLVGTTINAGQVSGPQGNPNGSAQPRAWPSTDSVGNPVSFGAKLTPPQYGAAAWGAKLPVNNRIAGNQNASSIEGLMKQPARQMSF